jgi:hypothetical protein
MVKRALKFKKISISCILAFYLFTPVFAQDKTACEKIVESYVEAVNSKSFEQIEKVLAPDFTCIGQKGTVAMMVLKQVSTQVINEITDYSQISATEENNELRMVYSMTGKLGAKETSFLFNSNNQLKGLEISGLATKRMNSNETNVENSEKGIIQVRYS